MGKIVEIDDRGAIQLPDDLLATVKPRTRFLLEIHGATLILRPTEEQPFWLTASPAERAEVVRRWASLDRPPAPVPADEALSREQMYDR